MANDLNLTLREAYVRYLSADHKKLRTVESYCSTLNVWGRLIGEDVIIGHVTNDTLAAFRDKCLALQLSPATFNRHRRSLRAIFRRLGPQEYRNPAGLGLIQRIPYVKPLPTQHRFPRIASFSELERLYEACATATTPGGAEIPPCDFWRAFLVLGFNLLPRCSDLLALQTANVDFPKKQISFVAEKTGRRHVLPMNAVVLAHVRRIFPTGEFLLSGADWILSSMRTRFYPQWYALQYVADISPRFGPHCLRKTGASFYHSVQPGIADWICGHSMSDVTGRYYLNPLEAGTLQATAERLPQPEAFKRILDDPAQHRNIVDRMRRSEWSFAAGPGRYGSTMVSYRGHLFRLPTRLATLLQSFVAARGPLAFSDLRRVVFYDAPEIDTTTIRVTVSQLRTRLIEAFKLARSSDPIPFDHVSCGWVLRLPPIPRKEA